MEEKEGNKVSIIKDLVHTVCSWKKMRLTSYFFSFFFFISWRLITLQTSSKDKDENCLELLLLE